MEIQLHDMVVFEGNVWEVRDIDTIPAGTMLYLSDGFSQTYAMVADVDLVCELPFVAA